MSRSSLPPNRLEYFPLGWFMPGQPVVTLREDTKGWDGSDGRVHRIYPSSSTAWMYQDLSDGSREQNSQTQLDVPDNMGRSWTDGDVVAHEHQVSESTSPGLDRKRDLRTELRGTEVLEAIMAGAVIAVAVAVFLGGIMVGVIAVVAVSVRREDRRYTLAVDAPGLLARSTRRLTGVSRRDLDADFLRPVGELVH